MDGQETRKGAKQHCDLRIMFTTPGTDARCMAHVRDRRSLATSASASASASAAAASGLHAHLLVNTDARRAWDIGEADAKNLHADFDGLETVCRTSHG
jgi:hypothetical protein